MGQENSKQSIRETKNINLQEYGNPVKTIDDKFGEVDKKLALLKTWNLFKENFIKVYASIRLI